MVPCGLQDKAGAQSDFPRLTTHCCLKHRNIRIYHECEGRIEKSVPIIAVWHHKVCQVMTNSDPEGRIFLSYPHKNNGFSFLLTTVQFIY